MATISASGTFIRSGPASTSAVEPSRRRSTTGAENPRTRTRAPGTSSCSEGSRSGSALTPRSACDSARCASTAASASPRASERASPSRRLDCFSICARSSRSFTASSARAIPFSCSASASANRFSSSAMRFFCRSTHSSRSARRSCVQFARLLGQLALHPLEGVAAAMQVRNQPRSLARFRRQQRARPFDNASPADPSRRAIAIPLDPPGTPTRSR